MIKNISLPLYCTLIPDENLRNKTLPELFECDLEEMFQFCEVYADSKDVNGLIVAFYTLKTDAYLIKEDHSLKTLRNFIRGKNYLSSNWTNTLDEKKRIHIIYFAVCSTVHGTGIAHKLISEVLEYADKYSLYISLETHNPNNGSIYEHYGFKIYKKIKSHMDLNQYCMLRAARYQYL